jgi:hypothetical protein
VGFFWLGWDTKISGNPNPNKTLKSQTQPKNHQNLDPNIQKFQFLGWDFLGFLGLLGFLGFSGQTGFLGQVEKKS